MARTNIRNIASRRIDSGDKDCGKHHGRILIRSHIAIRLLNRQANALGSNLISLSVGNTIHRFTLIKATREV